MKRQGILWAAWYAALLALTPAAAGMTSAAECQIELPAAEVEITSSYGEPSEYAETTRPYRSFYQRLSKAADGDVGPREEACAMRGLTEWARAGVLLGPTLTFESKRQRIRYAHALNIALAKLSDRGRKVPKEVIEWAKELARVSARDFQLRRRVVGGPDNLWVWSGVTAASFLLLEAEPSLVEHQQRVWSDSISGIAPDGTIKRELRRGKRALLYSVYYLSALRWLQALREKRSLQSTSFEQEAITRLEHRVEDALCRSRLMPTRPEAQVTPNRLSFESIPVFSDTGYVQRLLACGAPLTNKSSPLSGGDFEKTKGILLPEVR
jgi:poly(beta-D-mannuronate) lyase